MNLCFFKGNQSGTEPFRFYTILPIKASIHSDPRHADPRPLLHAALEASLFLGPALGGNGGMKWKEINQRIAYGVWARCWLFDRFDADLVSLNT